MVFVNGHVDRDVQMTYSEKVAFSQKDKLLGCIQEVLSMSDKVYRGIKGCDVVFVHRWHTRLCRKSESMTPKNSWR